jgi:hypothetical protein
MQLPFGVIDRSTQRCRPGRTLGSGERLYHYLRHHPQIFMPETNEVNFFNPLRDWGRGVES